MSGPAQYMTGKHSGPSGSRRVHGHSQRPVRHPVLSPGPDGSLLARGGPRDGRGCAGAQRPGGVAGGPPSRPDAPHGVALADTTEPRPALATDMVATAGRPPSTDTWCAGRPPPSPLRPPRRTPLEDAGSGRVHYKGNSRAPPAALPPSCRGSQATRGLPVQNAARTSDTARAPRPASPWTAHCPSACEKSDLRRQSNMDLRLCHRAPAEASMCTYMQPHSSPRNGSGRE